MLKALRRKTCPLSRGGFFSSLPTEISLEGSAHTQTYARTPKHLCPCMHTGTHTGMHTRIPCDLGASERHTQWNGLAVRPFALPSPP